MALLSGTPQSTTVAPLQTDLDDYVPFGGTLYLETPDVLDLEATGGGPAPEAREYVNVGGVATPVLWEG